jgi:hypothetical protein
LKNKIEKEKVYTIKDFYDILELNEKEKELNKLFN